jgi:hypothetical protein
MEKLLVANSAFGVMEVKDLSEINPDKVELFEDENTFYKMLSPLPIGQTIACEVSQEMFDRIYSEFGIR